MLLKLLRLLYSVIYTFFISSGYQVLKGMITRQEQGIHGAWADDCCRRFGVSFKFLPGSAPVQKSRRTLLLANHRSWADFFIHDTLVEHSASFLAR
jgi:hypothetical protein